MYIATNETRLMGDGIVKILPRSLRRIMYNINLDEALEIRLVNGSPVRLRFCGEDAYITRRGNLSKDAAAGIRADRGMIAETLERITKSSLYSYEDEIRNGFITVDGGHRVGLAGTTVVENGAVEFIREISAMNIRIAHEILGAADSVADRIYNGGAIRSTLIISPPGAGKTTMLRDIARQLSERGVCTAIADERCEIAAMYEGRSAFDIGSGAVVMDGCPKPEAMQMLLRSMSPEALITDELGTAEDAAAVGDLINCGCAVIASLHARDEAQLQRRALAASLLPLFDMIITLSKKGGAGHIESISVYD